MDGVRLDEVLARGHTRPVWAGDRRFVVACADRAVVARLDHLLAGVPDAAPGAPAVVLEIRVTDRPGPGRPTNRYETGRHGGAGTVESLLASDDLAEHELVITRALNEAKLDGEPHLLHLHSAAVARDGRAVLIVGGSGDGKSTLAAALVQRGFAYVTDEQVTLRPDDAAILPFARPVTLRRQVWPLFAGVTGVPPQDPGDAEWRRVEVSPYDLGAVHADGPLVPAVIVVPGFEVGATTTSRPVPVVADVVERLALSCHDVDRLGMAGFELLVELARRCAAHELVYGDLDDAHREVVRVLAESPAHAPPSVHHHSTPRSAVAADVGVVVRAPDTHAFVFGDGSSTLYQPATRRITRLDGAGLARWEQLASPCALTDLLASEPTEAARDGLARWVEALVANGFLVIGA